MELRGVDAPPKAPDKVPTTRAEAVVVSNLIGGGQKRSRRIAKDLRDLDRTDGGKFDHYSAADVARACGASQGQNHE